MRRGRNSVITRRNGRWICRSIRQAFVYTVYILFLPDPILLSRYFPHIKMREVEKMKKKTETVWRKKTNTDEYPLRKAVLSLSAYFCVSATDRLPLSVSPPLPVSDIVKVGEL